MADIKRPGAQDATGSRDTVQAANRTDRNIHEAQSDPNLINGDGPTHSSDWEPDEHLDGKERATRARSARVDDALALAEAGLPVFPCNPDKRPRVKWREAATRDPAKVRSWWVIWPDALPAVPTGAPSGFFAVDADVDKKTGEAVGERTLRELGLDVARHPYAQATPSGGCHLFFRWQPDHPRNSVNNLPAVDIRSEGGYVIVYDAVKRHPELPPLRHEELPPPSG